MKNKSNLSNHATWLRAHIQKPVVLVGMMGTGKSQLGARLARRLEMPFADSDSEIERRAGCSVAEVFTRDGQERFRAVEQNVILELLARTEPHIIATGGGAVTRPETLALIKAKAVSIWLNADPATILSRVRDVTTRPLLNQPDPEAALKNLLDARTALYQQADVHIMADNERIQETLDQMIVALYGYLRHRKE
ncbi:MAG: shikimate kinase [Alphaproteobacteria bacterium]|nr:shikimate kinase [Alphaproteobacteria bacterium]